MRKEKLLAKIGGTPSKAPTDVVASTSMKTTVDPGQDVLATPGKTRITGKRAEKATPIPTMASPQVPTPGLKHGKYEGDEDVKKGRKLFNDEDLPVSTSSDFGNPARVYTDLKTPYRLAS